VSLDSYEWKGKTKMGSIFPVRTASPDEQTAFWQTYVPNWRKQTIIDVETICKAFPSMDQEDVLLLIKTLHQAGEKWIAFEPDNPADSCAEGSSEGEAIGNLVIALEEKGRREVLAYQKEGAS
jgi:hypothetical protein